MYDKSFVAGIKVFSVGRLEWGLTTGGQRLCNLEGCRGMRLSVRWPKGPGDKRTKVTYPCTKDMRWDEATQSWEIT